MTGYWRKPDETEFSFVGRFFRTDDVGYMDEDGYIFIVDRIKSMISGARFKVHPRCIEDALYEHTEVAEVCVVGISDDCRDEAPKAYVRPNLSKLELPAAIEFRDELPKTMIGKLLKKALCTQAQG